MTDNDEKAVRQFPPAAFEEWFAAIEAGDGSIPVPQSIADGEAWHEHIGRRQIALGAWLAATEVATTQAVRDADGVAVASICLVTDKRYPHFAAAEIQLFNGYEPKIGDRLYLTPPAAVPVGKLRELAAKLRAGAHGGAYKSVKAQVARAEAYRGAADLIEQLAREHEDGQG